MTLKAGVSAPSAAFLDATAEVVGAKGKREVKLTHPAPPAPLIDPGRALWEAVLIAAYGDCGRRHSAAVRAIDEGDR